MTNLITPDEITELPKPKRRPEWLKVRAPGGEKYEWLQGLMRSKSLNTVCEEAMCPNLGECWSKKTATFMILGDICTRNCGFCAIAVGKPLEVDADEPRRVAESAREMGGSEATEPHAPSLLRNALAFVHQGLRAVTNWWSLRVR